MKDEEEEPKSKAGLGKKKKGLLRYALPDASIHRTQGGLKK